jgi:hypothetical protein
VYKRQVVTEERDFWTLASGPEHGAYVNETLFLTDPSGIAPRVTRIEGAARRLALFSDGIERMVLDGAHGRAHAPFFRAAFAALAAARPGVDRGLSARLRAWIASPTFATRTDDDITLILAERGAPASGGAHMSTGPADQSRREFSRADRSDPADAPRCLTGPASTT